MHKIWLQFALVSCALVFAGGAATHGGRERESDGSFSPKDRGHVDGDDHNKQFDHEAILGSQKEAEEFDHLPPALAKERLLKLAEKMDRNGDGFVDKTELHQWILRSFRMLSQEDSDERLAENDLDKDGFVQWSEYKENEFQNLDGVDEIKDGMAMDPAALDELSMMFEDKILFDAADFNKDGKLNNDEYFSFSHPEDDLERMKDSVLQLTRETKDKNKDGVIDFKEFVGDRAKDQDKEWLKSEKERFDDELDKNKDGSLDVNEVLEWIIPDNNGIAQDEVDHLFASCDDDHDDKLSKVEVEKHHDIFVGSEATDYGEHLHKVDRFMDEL